MQGPVCRKGRFTPLSLLVLLLVDGLPLANGSCKFPSSWTGKWFQNGKPQPIIINETMLGGKSCIEQRADTYLAYDNAEQCYGCLIINAPHENVIQYREVGYCSLEQLSLAESCAPITSDDTFYSMFRLDSKPIPCPFSGPPFTFTYNKGHSTCESPVSQAESCTDESRLLLKYQACPDVYATESSTEELQCLAKWKDGRNHYLVGTIKQVNDGRNVNEEVYRCFLYEQKTHHEGKVVYSLAQSGDASCNGLTSINEGSRTITLTKVNKEHSKCKYPSWVTLHHEWHSLDGTRRYHFTSRNATLKVISQDNNGDSYHEEKIVCHNLEKLYPNDNFQGHKVKLVAHITSGCDIGYVCMIFHKREGHVIELQQSSQKAIMPDEACSLYDPSNSPYTTLIAPTLHERKCPQPGRYTILDNSASTNPISRQRKRSLRGAERRTWQPHEESEEKGCKNTDIQIGCSSKGQNELTVANTCEEEEVTYSCHGSWEEKGVWYTVVSQRSKLTAGLGQTFCFAMRQGNGASVEKLSSRHEQQEQELWLSSPARTCQRKLTDPWTYRLANQGVCEDLTKEASSSASSSSLSRVSLVIMSLTLLCCLQTR